MIVNTAQPKNQNINPSTEKTPKYKKKKMLGQNDPEL